MPTPLSDTEPIWGCDYCDADFDNRDEAEEHEATCSKRAD